MTTIQRVCLVALASLLAACGAAGEEKAPPPIEETVFDDVVGTMDEAREVENMTREHKEALDRALEQSEGSGEQ